MLSAADAAERAVHHVTGLTGRTAESVIGIERAGQKDEGWRVTVEVVETHRIPDSADILAIYQAEVDGAGELVSYRRLRRYPRGRAGQD